MPRFFRVGDCIADTGFIDWTISWYCESGPDQVLIEKINEECSPGYTSNPTYHLSDLLGTEECEWDNGVAIVTTEDGETYRVVPTYYGGDVGAEVLDEPSTGSGWLSDAAIDTEGWLESVLCAGDAEEITDTVEFLMDNVHGHHAVWDNSDGVAEVLRVIDTIDSNYEQGATAKIVAELNSEISQDLPEDVQKETESLHRKLQGLLDRVYAGNGDYSEEEIEELVDSIG
jgi:uncharacterized protein (DUF2267 family)